MKKTRKIYFYAELSILYIASLLIADKIALEKINLWTGLFILGALVLAIYNGMQNLIRVKGAGR